MRIAHFVQRYPPALGGSEAYFQRLSRYHAAHGDRVTVWTTVARDLSAFWSPTADCFAAGREQDGDIEIRRYPLWRMRGRRWILKPLSSLPLRAWQAMTLPCNPISMAMWRDAGTTQEPFDAVHATAFPYAWPIVCARRLARRQGIPFLLTPFLHLADRRTRKAYTQPALRRLLQSADTIFAQTELERNAIIGLGVPAERVVLQGLGVDTSECTGGDRTAARATWNVGEGGVVVGHLANLSAEKGTIDLVRAMENLPNVTLVLAGPAMPNFERFMVRHRGRVRVVRLGVLSDAGKRNLFAGIDIFALPSRSDSFGLVLLEAWANGVPNVSYRAGGPGEIIRHGTDGLLAPVGDLAALGECLSQLVQSREMRQELGETGRARLDNEFRWDDKLQRVRDVQLEQNEPQRKPVLVFSVTSVSMW